MTSAHKWYLQFVKKKINYHVFITIKQKYFGLVLENFEEKKIQKKAKNKFKLNKLLLNALLIFSSLGRGKMLKI